MNFLQSIAQYYLDHQNTNRWDKLIFVFPSNRSAVFFRNSIKEQLHTKKRAIFGINTTTIASLFADKANLYIPDNITLALELWDVYKDVFKADINDFEFFYSWASTFISDFSDIDSYLIDARQILSNANDFEAYRDDYSHLNDSQREAIERFFGVAIKGDNKEYQHYFNTTYQNLYPLYTQYRNSLKHKGLAYTGMLYRYVAESLKEADYFNDNHHYVFIGLNALSTAEQKVLSHLKTLSKADFFWDNPKDFPSLFIDKFSQQFPAPKDYIYPVSTQKTEIISTSFPTAHAQIYGVNNFLKTVNPNEKNAIILADENMLLPVISSLQDEDIQPVNVTMGYPIKQSQLYGYISTLKPILRTIKPKDIPQYLRDIFVQKTAEYEADELSIAIIEQVQKTINQLEKFLTREELQQQSSDFIYSIFISLLRNQTVDFCGYPLEGLQIMGILETRAVDFDNLVILDVNEGILPKSSITESFIPPTLRHGFGLPTYAYRDAMSSYYFFRLIYRTKTVHLLYSSSSTDNSKGKSRYLLQLQYQYNDKINYSELPTTQPLNPVETDNELIEKNPQIMLRIKDFFSNHLLSPTLLIQYLTCGKMFYFANIVGLSLAPDNEENNDIDNRLFGNIYHYAMEQIIKNKAGDIDRLLIDGFNNELHLHITSKDDLEGRNYLYYSVLHEYIEKTTKIFPPQNAKIIKCEDRVTTSINTAIGEITLGGKIDLQYLHNDKYCVLDYKTGKVDKDKVKYNPEKLFTKDNKEILQTLIYCYILRKNGINSDLYPQILSLSRLYSHDFSTSIINNKEPLSYDQVEAFEEQLQSKINEIFDINTPFHPSEDKDAWHSPCDWCDFTSICKKYTLNDKNQ